MAEPLTLHLKVASQHGSLIILIARDAQGKRYTVQITDFKPHFFVDDTPDNRATLKKRGLPHDIPGRPSLYGNPTLRVEVDTPGSVPKRRKGFDRTFEADGNVEDVRLPGIMHGTASMGGARVGWETCYIMQRRALQRRVCTSSGIHGTSLFSLSRDQAGITIPSRTETTIRIRELVYCLPLAKNRPSQATGDRSALASEIERTSPPRQEGPLSSSKDRGVASLFGRNHEMSLLQNARSSVPKSGSHRWRWRCKTASSREDWYGVLRNACKTRLPFRLPSDVSQLQFCEGNEGEVSA